MSAIVSSGLSEKQWSDVLGVLAVQAGKLDLAYLDGIARVLGVADLVDRAMSEVKREPTPPAPASR